MTKPTDARLTQDTLALGRFASMLVSLAIWWVCIMAGLFVLLGLYVVAPRFPQLLAVGISVATTALGAIAYLRFLERRVSSWVHVRYGVLRLVENINKADVQQYLANGVSILKFYRSHQNEMLGLPRSRHNFPVRTYSGLPHSTPRTLARADLVREASQCMRESSVRSVELWEALDGLAEVFVNPSMPRLSKYEGVWSVDLGEEIRRIERSYPFFNKFKPLHRDDLVRILHGEGIMTHFTRDSEVLSNFVEYRERNGARRWAVVVKDSIHPAHIEFVLAHEIGHWFLHLSDTRNSDLGNESLFLHSSRASFEWGRLESDADKLAMIALFPTPYLANMDIYGRLTVEALVEDFVGSEPPSDQLREVMCAYVDMRIHQYKGYRNRLLDLEVPPTPIAAENLQGVLGHWGNHYRWARVGRDCRVVECSQSYADLFRATREDMVGKHLLDDLTRPDLRASVEAQWNHRILERRPTFYFTELLSSRGDLISTAVYAVPVEEDGRGAGGSIGVLFPME